MGSLLLHCGNGDALFLADRRAAFQRDRPLPGFEARVVDEHIRQYCDEYNGEDDVDELDVFHARLDG